MLAAGAGAYNVQTAQAASVNVDTVARYNQYLWEAQSERNYNYYVRQVQDRQNKNEAANAIYQRVRNNPTNRDIELGNALNVVYDELSNPKVFVQSLSAASTSLPPGLIRNIPFQKAAAGITTSFYDLTRSGSAPAVFRTPAFAQLRLRFLTLAEQLRTQDEDTGTYDPETLKAIQDLFPSAWKTLDTALPDKDSRERREAERYMKSLQGLFRMMEMPNLDIFLAGTKGRPDISLGDLLRFMTSFSLRFGAATTPEQINAYHTLYPLLVQLRDQAVPAESRMASLTPPPHPSPQPVQEFFDGMDRADLNAKKTPPAPAPGN